MTREFNTFLPDRERKVGGQQVASAGGKVLGGKHHLKDPIGKNKIRANGVSMWTWST